MMQTFVVIRSSVVVQLRWSPTMAAGVIKTWPQRKKLGSCTTETLAWLLGASIVNCRCNAKCIPWLGTFEIWTIDRIVVFAHWELVHNKFLTKIDHRIYSLVFCCKLHRIRLLHLQDWLIRSKLLYNLFSDPVTCSLRHIYRTVRIAFRDF